MAESFSAAEGFNKLAKALGLTEKRAKAATKAVDKLNKTALNKTGSEGKRAAKIIEDLTRQLAKFNAQSKKTRKKTRLLNNTFATMRSKILLFNFAMGLGIRQLGKFAKEAAKVESMNRAFNTLSGGIDSGTVAIEKLKVATNNTMSQFDLFQQANNAMILGVSKNSDEMAEMFDIAQRLGRALGRDTASSVESLITGIGRQSRLMLDNIGIIVKADEAYEKYANKIGTTADKLSDADKKTAFLEATMESARAKINTLGTETLSSQDSFDAFSATVKDLSVMVGDRLKGAFSGAMDAFVRFVDVNKAADVETAMTSKSYEVLAITVDRLKNKLEESEAASRNQGIAFNAGVGIYSLSAEKIKEMKDQIASLQTEMANLLFIIDAEPFKTPFFEKWADFDRDSTIEVINRFNQESESLLNDFWTKRHAQNLQAFAIEESALIAAAQDTIDNETALQQTILEIQEHFANERKKLSEGEAKIEEEILKEKISSYQELGTAFSDVGSLFRSNVEQNMKADINAARQTSEYKMARERGDRKTMEALEKEAKNKHHDSLVAAFRMEQASSIANIIMNFAQAHAKTFATMPLPAALASMPLLSALTATQIGLVASQSPPQKFAQGGIVGGRRHSQGGTMIEAEQGEFVMNRSAVQAIGIENLNRMNQGGASGGITVNVSGNVMSQDYVEGELAEQIKEAIRKGNDFGVS